MTSTTRERAFVLYKEGFDTGTKISKQLEAEGFEGVSRGAAVISASAAALASAR